MNEDNQIEKHNENQIKDYQQQLNSQLKSSFTEQNLALREIEFKNFLKLIEKIANEIINEPEYQEVFNLHFLRQIVKIVSEQMQFQMKQSVMLLQSVLQRTLISNRLLNLKGAERTVIELINILLTMKSQFRHTYLELPIQHMIQGVAVLLENNGDKFITKNLKLLTEKELMHQEQKETLERLRSELVENKSKNEFIKFLQLSLSQSEAVYDQFELFGGVIQDYVTDFITQLKKETQQQKMQYFSQLLCIYERYICQTQFTVMLELYNIHETKTYILKNEKQLILNHPFIYYGCALLLNEILMMPNEISMQLRAFNLIKRLYEYFPQLKDVLKGPILLVLKNISLFAQTSVELKEPTIFLYQICHSSQYDEEYKKTLIECEGLKYLRQNKYYSVKALSFTEDNGQIYNLRNLNIQVMFPNYTIINAASIFVYSLCIEKTNSIVYWNFKTLDYDIGFGLFKLSQG